MPNITKNRKMVDYVKKNDWILVEAMIHQGAKANYKHGIALRHACWFKDRFVIAKLLIDKGADYNYKEKGYSALEICKVINNEEVLLHIKNKERLSKLKHIENVY